MLVVQSPATVKVCLHGHHMGLYNEPGLIPCDSWCVIGLPNSPTPSQLMTSPVMSFLLQLGP